MNPELDPQEIGSQLGENGVKNVVTNVEQYCAHAVRCIALENRAPIAMLTEEYRLLEKQAEHIEAQLRDAPPPGDLRHYRRKKIFAWLVTGVLTIAAFFLAVLTFAPFRLGWLSYLFCIGIAIVGPFLMEELFEGGKLDRLAKPLAAITLASGIASLMLMAHVRGNLLKHEVETPPAVVIDDAQPEQPAPQDDFYGKSTDLLTLATVLLSLAMELGGGLALRRAWAKAPHNAEDYQRLQRELATVHGRKILIGGEVTQLDAEPGIFEAQLWRDFYKSMLTHAVQSAMRKLLIALVMLTFVQFAHAATPDHLNLVVALDLTKSSDVKGPDGKTEFQKNVEGVTGVLAQVPAGSHVMVIGITDRSFAQPYILLSAAVPDDPGYFGERLNAAHNDLARAWKQRSAKLQPTFPGTDILGALRLASQIFDHQPSAGEHKVLVLFSDMRNHTKELDLESEKGLAVALKNQNVEHTISDLRDVQAFALGVDGADSTRGDWQRILAYWQQFFSKHGADIKEFSPLRQARVVAAQ